MSNSQDTIRFEHAALNLPDYQAATAWYKEHLGLQIARDYPGEKTFLADGHGRTILELYTNPDAPFLDLHQTNSLSLHLAFNVDDPDTTADRLVAAGASLESAPVDSGPDRVIWLKDPFGVSIQLIRRQDPMP